MKKTVTVILFLASLLISQSCREAEFENQPLSSTQNVDDVNRMQEKFAKMLALSLRENQDLRIFIKQEALRKFDNDYDILYQMVRDANVAGKTFHEILSTYDSDNSLASIEEKLPLLTIYVPELPEFSAGGWNPEAETPQVGVALQNSDNVPIYDADGVKVNFAHHQIPGFPVLVVKQNERVTTDAKNSSSSNGKAIQSFNASGSNFSFYFVDDEFNGINPKVKQSTARWTASLDQKIIDAYYHQVYRGLEWQRDHIYYNLRPKYAPQDPGVTKGKLNNNYSEFLASFKLSPAALNVISDQSPDPTVKQTKTALSQPSWTEGNFEFRMSILVNSTNGIGSTITKVFSASGADLYYVTYKKVNTYYVVDKISSKEFYPNIELIPWDLQSYSFGWKFIFSEFDLSQQIVNTYQNTSKFATNFGFDIGLDTIVKLGFKFGASTETTNVQTHSITTSLDSDFLGEATLTFDQPVIIGGPSNTSGPTTSYETREITTGSYLSVSIEPKKLF